MNHSKRKKLKNVVKHPKIKTLTFYHLVKYNYNYKTIHIGYIEDIEEAYKSRQNKIKLRS